MTDDDGHLLLRLRVTHLECGAPPGRLPRSVRHAGRPAGIFPGLEFLIQGEVNDASLQDVHFFPEVVIQDTVGRGVTARIEAQHACVVAAVGIPAENTFVQSAALAPRHVPPGFCIDVDKFQFFLGKFFIGHGLCGLLWMLCRYPTCASNAWRSSRVKWLRACSTMSTSTRALQVSSRRLVTGPGIVCPIRIPLRRPTGRRHLLVLVMNASSAL